MFIFVLNALSLCQTLICSSFTKQTLAKFIYEHASFKYGTMCFNKDYKLLMDIVESSLVLNITVCQN